MNGPPPQLIITIILCRSIDTSSMKLKVLLGALGLSYNHTVSSIGTMCSTDLRPYFDCPPGLFSYLIVGVNRVNSFIGNVRTHQSFFYARGTCLQSLVSVDERSDCALIISAQHKKY